MSDEQIATAARHSHYAVKAVVPLYHRFLSDDDDENVTRPTDTTVSNADGRSSMGQAGASSASDGRLAAATRAGWTRAAPARGIAPRLAESRRLDAVTEPLSSSQIWLQDFLINFLRDQLRQVMKRRGDSPYGAQGAAGP